MPGVVLAAVFNRDYLSEFADVSGVVENRIAAT
jgi:hypothetical protein